MEITDGKNTFTPEQLDNLGVSPEVAAKFKTEIEAELKTDPAPANDTKPDNQTVDNNPSAATVTTSTVPPTGKGAEVTTSEPSLEEQLAKEYPGGTVPIAALIAERKKRQELEKQAKTAPTPAVNTSPTVPQGTVIPFNQPAVAQTQPQIATVPAPAPMPAIDNKRLVQEAISLWEKNNPGQVFDTINPVHMAELMDCKTQVKEAYDQIQQQHVTAQQETQRQQQMQQRYQTEVVGTLHAAYGTEFAAIDKFAGEMLAADPKEQYYVFGSLMQGNFQPMHEFYAKAAAKYRETITPKPIVKTEAEKVDEINALPKSSFIPTGEKGNTRTMADIEKMIADGSWAKLPEAEREAIINQVGGGAI
jgi:hypothetical protein